MKRIQPSAYLFSLLCICLLLPLTLFFTACSGEPADQNSIRSVVLKDGTVTVEVSLTRGFLDSYTEGEVYLFELPSVYSTDAALSELDPIDRAKPKETMTFRIPAQDGVRSRLYSSYLVAAYDPATRHYTPLTTPMALSNPEAASDYTPPVPCGESSIKGLISDHPADAVRLGISHTVVEAPMEKLILSDWREGAVSYVYGGVTRYLDGAVLSELDETVRVYTAAGVRVYLRFTLGSPAGCDVPVGLYVPTYTSVSHPKDFAVDMSNVLAAGVMEGFFDFMADRYASPEDGALPVSSFIVGYRVNDSQTHNYAGDLSLDAYVTNYEKLTRVVHTAVKSHNPDGRVYISLDSRRTVGAGDAGWDVTAFLAAFRKESALRGDYDWHMACELYADTPALWEENTTADAAYYTVRNLGTLTDVLNGETYRTPGGEARRLIISGLAIPAESVPGVPSEEDANRQAASYAYAYMTCVQNGGVEALLYSQHTDPIGEGEEAPRCGLWTLRTYTTLTSVGVEWQILPAEQRPIYHVFQRIDTTEASSLSGGLTQIIGASYTKLESALAGKASPVTCLQGTGKLQAFEDSHKKAAALYTFDGGSLNGFGNAGNLTYLELADAETLGRVTLHARFDRDTLCDPMGLTVTLSATQLIGGKELLFDLFAGPLQSGSGSSAKPTVTLRLTRAAKGSVAEGDGAILYEATVGEVKGGSWQTAVFPIADFAACLDASDEVTLTLLLEYPPETAQNGATAHNLGLAGVYVTGTTAAAGIPAGAVIAAVLVLALAVAGVFLLLFLRKRRRP